MSFLDFKNKGGFADFKQGLRNKEEPEELFSLPSRPLNNTTQTTTPSMIGKDEGTVGTAKKVGQIGASTFAAFKEFTTSLFPGGRKPSQTAIGGGFIDSTPTTVAAVQRSASLGLNLLDNIRPLQTSDSFYKRASQSLAKSADKNSALSQTLQEAYAIENPDLIEKGIKTKEGAGRLIGGMANNLLGTLGASTVGTVAGGPVGGLLAGATAGVALEGGFAYNDAKQFLENSEDPVLRARANDTKYLSKVAAVVGIGNGLLEALPITKLLSRNPIGNKFRKHIISQFVNRMIAQGLGEGSTESMQEIWGNVVAQTYNENQDLFEGVGEAFYGGAITGGALSGAIDTTSLTTQELKEAKALYDSMTPAEKQKGAINLSGFGKEEESIQSSISKAKASGQSFDEWVKGQGNEVYHGSYTKVDKFERGYFGDTTANNEAEVFYFTKSPKHATEYSREAFARRFEGEYYDKFPDMSGDDLMKKLYEDAGANIQINPSFVDIKNPKVMDWKGQTLAKRWQESYNFINQAKDEGYDGVIFKNISDDVNKASVPKQDVVIAFSPDQIKTRSQLKAEWDNTPKPITTKDIPTQETTQGSQTKKVVRETTTPQSPTITKKGSSLLGDKIKTIAKTTKQARRPLLAELRNVRKIISQEKSQTERFTRTETQAVQEAVIGTIDKSNLEAKDKAKFIKAIKNVQTRSQLEKTLPVIEERIGRLEQLEEARGIKNQINKELKKTQVKKQSGKPVGKFTPEVQKVLDVLRSATKLKVAEAEAKLVANLEKYSNEIPPLEVTLENRILSISSGLSTIEESQALLDDIKTLKQGGRELNALKSFNKETERQRGVELVVDRVTGGKGIDPTRVTTGAPKTTALETLKQNLKTFGKKWIMGWRGQMGILDWNSPVDNKVLANEFDVQDQETRYKELQEKYANTAKDIIVQSYGIEDKDSSVFKKVTELQEEVEVGTFKNSEGDSVTIKMTRDELIKRYMELQDPSLRDSFIKGNKYTDEIISAVEGSLTAQDKAFAEAQLELYREHYDEVNEVYRVIYGVDLPFNEFYSPIRRSGYNIDTESQLGEFMDEQSFRQAVTSSALKSRVDTSLPIEKQGSLSALDKHFSQTNYFIAWADRVRYLQSVFTNSNVRTAIKDEFGGEMLNAVGNTIEDFATNGQGNGKRTIRLLDTFRKNFTIGVLAIKPAIAIKQLLSLPAYLEVLSPTEFAVGTADFWRNPVKNLQQLMKESTVLRNRGSNLERDIRDAMQTDVYKRFTKKQNFFNTLMMNVQFGDIGAISVGAWAMRRARIAQYQKAGDSFEVATKKAIKDYESFSSDTQQSADQSQLSQVQRGGSFEKLFTMFKSAPTQYLRKEVNATQSLFQTGGLSGSNVKKVAKTLAIYHFVLPMIFQFVSDFGEFDEDEQKRAALMGSLNGLFIAGDVIDAIVRNALGLRVFDTEIPIVTIADDVNKAVSNIEWDDISNSDFMEALEGLVGASTKATGIPAEQVFDMSKGVGDIMEGDSLEGFGQLLGWSEYSVTNGEKDDSVRSQIKELRDENVDVRGEIRKLREKTQETRDEINNLR